MCRPIPAERRWGFKGFPLDSFLRQKDAVCGRASDKWKTCCVPLRRLTHFPCVLKSSMIKLLFSPGEESQEGQTLIWVGIQIQPTSTLLVPQPAQNTFYHNAQRPVQFKRLHCIIQKESVEIKKIRIERKPLYSVSDSLGKIGVRHSKGVFFSFQISNAKPSRSGPFCIFAIFPTNEDDVANAIKVRLIEFCRLPIKRSSSLS